MNSKRHLMVSVVKSAIRIVGSVLATLLAIHYNDIHNAVAALALCFGVAEILGIFEELVDKR